MNRYSVKAAACALVGTLSLSGYQTTLEAKLNHSSDVPAAGVAVVLDDSSTGSSGGSGSEHCLS